MKDLSIIIPTLNEEDNIAQVIGKCKKYSSEIIIVDDGSTDKTQEISKRFGAKLVERKGKKRGLTASILEGIKNTKTKYFIVIDGDGQHPPEIIPKIYHKLKNNDLVVGVRASVQNWAVHRKLMSKTAEILGRLRLLIKGTKCSDILSGFFGARTSYVKDYVAKNRKCFVSEGYKILFDILKHSENIKIAEVPYTFSERSGGKSKIGKKQIIAFLKSLLL